MYTSLLEKHFLELTSFCIFHYFPVLSTFAARRTFPRTSEGETVYVGDKGSPTRTHSWRRLRSLLGEPLSPTKNPVFPHSLLHMFVVRTPHRHSSAVLCRTRCAGLLHWQLSVHTVHHLPPPYSSHACKRQDSEDVYLCQSTMRDTIFMTSGTNLLMKR